MTIQTTMRNELWTIQKQEGKRWGLVKDSNGIIILPNRKLARDVARELRIANKGAKIRVACMKPIEKKNKT